MSEDNSGSRSPVLVLFLVSLLNFLPLIIFYKNFKRLFWFGDELHLLTLLSRTDFSKWAFTNFAENFDPVFKFIWGGATIIFNGSYLAMIILVWVVHVSNSFLFGLILFRHQFTLRMAALCSLSLGLASSLIESVGYALQLNALLATFFMLLAWNLLEYYSRSALKKIAIFGILSIAASCFCFSRGALSGFMMAAYLFAIFYWFKLQKRERGSLAFTFACLVPALLSITIITRYSSGNHHELVSGGIEVATKMVQFALVYLVASPLNRLAAFDDIPTLNLIVFGVLKYFLIIVALLNASKRTDKKMLLALLVFLAFDFGNAFLLGVGRYHTGLRFATSSRYQYESMICFVPFLAMFFEARAVLKKLFFVWTFLWLFFITRHWSPIIKDWSKWRGSDGRHVLLKDFTPAQGQGGTQVWIGIPPVITFEEAKLTVKYYNLH